MLVGDWFRPSHLRFLRLGFTHLFPDSISMPIHRLKEKKLYTKEVLRHSIALFVNEVFQIKINRFESIIRSSSLLFGFPSLIRRPKNSFGFFLIDSFFKDY